MTHCWPMFMLRMESCFLDAPGVYVKTFLVNLLLAKIRKGKIIAVAVASSGVAATLLAEEKLLIPLSN